MTCDIHSESAHGKLLMLQVRWSTPGLIIERMSPWISNNGMANKDHHTHSSNIGTQYCTWNLWLCNICSPFMRETFPCICRLLASWFHGFLPWINARICAGYQCSLETCWPYHRNTLKYTNSSCLANLWSRSQNMFLLIVLDHNHEQLNEMIKGEGGAVGLTEDPTALRHWMISGPEIACVVTEFEETFSKSNTGYTPSWTSTWSSKLLC